MRGIRGATGGARRGGRGGGVVTAGALHTQRNWCRTVRAQGGDYVLIAKKNQRGLHEDLAILFGGVWPRWLEQRTGATLDKGHGRIEVRQGRAGTDLNELVAGRRAGFGSG